MKPSSEPTASVGTMIDGLGANRCTSRSTTARSATTAPHTTTTVGTHCSSTGTSERDHGADHKSNAVASAQPPNRRAGSR